MMDCFALGVLLGAVAGAAGVGIAALIVYRVTRWVYGRHRTRKEKL